MKITVEKTVYKCDLCGRSLEHEGMACLEDNTIHLCLSSPLKRDQLGNRGRVKMGDGKPKLTGAFLPSCSDMWDAGVRKITIEPDCIRSKF